MGQILSFPLDITWQRFGYSRDMLDVKFADADAPPKWRSSMAVYSYVVPAEQTVESYPEGRVVYLRLTCSITGWNLSEELRGAVNLSEVGDRLDDLQRGTWEAIQADGWARVYWGCMGAIATASVFPGRDDTDVAPDDYPYILDFEPKKRELYETSSEGAEFLSASSEAVNVQKGTTSLDHTEKTASVTVSGGMSFGPLGGGSASATAGITKSQDNTTLDMHTTDNSQDRRETTSFSTNFEQMYQLFNGYHLGTNRAMFVIAPRPHTANSGPVLGFNLIDGDRKLEGIQDMFLIAYVPNKLKGICVQATLDTGHKVKAEPPATVLYRDPERQPNGEDERPGGGGGTGGGTGGGGTGGGSPELPEEPDYLVVTRRTIGNCARFSEDGQLVLVGAPREAPDVSFPPPAVFEAALPASAPPAAIARMLRSDNEKPGDARAEVVNRLNIAQRTTLNAMLGGFSAGQYKQRQLTETRTFRRMVNLTLRNVNVGLDQVATGEDFSEEDRAVLQKAGARTIGDAFGPSIEGMRGIDRTRLNAIRNQIVNRVLQATKPRE